MQISKRDGLTMRRLLGVVGPVPGSTGANHRRVPVPTAGDELGELLDDGFQRGHFEIDRNFLDPVFSILERIYVSRKQHVRLHQGIIINIG